MLFLCLKCIKAPGWVTSLSLIFLWGFHAYVVKFGFLLFIWACLSQEPRRMEGKYFSPLHFLQESRESEWSPSSASFSSLSEWVRILPQSLIWKSGPGCSVPGMASLSWELPLISSLNPQPTWQSLSNEHSTPQTPVIAFCVLGQHFSVYIASGSLEQTWRGPGTPGWGGRSWGWRKKASYPV